MVQRYFSHQSLDGTRLQVGALDSSTTVTVALSTPGHDPQMIKLTPDKIEQLISSLARAQESLEAQTSYNDSLLWS